MTRIEQVEESIKRLPRDELYELIQWIKSHYESAWDQQIDEDIQSGKLGVLAKEALAEYHAGGTKSFPGLDEKPGQQ